ncbi:hypothetical protein [Streptomyces sp. NPDC088725]|uniref:hypothetical protein n=1 Tax=Streptomyces sp. NPDC088725 TaxID=3365873 RepID=UPI00381B58BD
MASDLERGVGALTRFQTRVNALLSDLEGGPASRKRVAAQKISRGSLSGTGAHFAEADGLYSQYNRVHEALVSLSQSLGDQIEALSIGVHAAEVGFDNVEEDMRRRYAEIQTRIDEEHAARRDREHGARPKQGFNDDRTGTTYDPGGN